MVCLHVGLVSTSERGSRGGDSVAVATPAFSSTLTDSRRAGGFLSTSRWAGKFKFSLLLEMVGLTTATEAGLTWAVVLTRAGGESGVTVVEAMGPSKRPLEASSLFISRLAMNWEKSMGSVMNIVLWYYYTPEICLSRDMSCKLRGGTSGKSCGATSGDLFSVIKAVEFASKICTSFYVSQGTLRVVNCAEPRVVTLK